MRTTTSFLVKRIRPELWTQNNSRQQPKFSLSPRTPTQRSVHHLTATSTSVDLRSDTVTQPTPEMLRSALTARTGDDVLGEDPTVQELQDTFADLVGKPAALFVPTGTMANLVAIAAHCDRRASEIIIGSQSHICRYEGGNVAVAAGVPTRQLPEDPETGELDLSSSCSLITDESDDHLCRTALVCVENTHNLLGGLPLSVSYLQQLSAQCHSQGVALHMDGARLANAVVAATNTTGESIQHWWRAYAAPCDTVTLCLSKGLGAPLGSLVAATDPAILHLAKRARKRFGGGMRQAGVVAAMGLVALRNGERLADDHRKAQELSRTLQEAGFGVLRESPPTNIVYCTVPKFDVVEYSTDTTATIEERNRRRTALYVRHLLEEYGVKISAGYGNSGNWIRIVTHLDIQDVDMERTKLALVDGWHHVAQKYV